MVRAVSQHAVEGVLGGTRVGMLQRGCGDGSGAPNQPSRTKKFLGVLFTSEIHTEKTQNELPAESLLRHPGQQNYFRPQGVISSLGWTASIH